MASTQEQFNHIQDQLTEFSNQLGRIASTLERDADDRKDFKNALGDFRDDLTDLRALGPKTHEAIQNTIKNEGRIDAIEAWRNQMVGAWKATHAMAGAIGGAFTIAADYAYHILMASPHR